jgi:beta-ureidopropionase / N-carbamoyl-L-amino-acid hydrolase
MKSVILGLPAFLVCVTSLISPVAQAQNANSPRFHINSQRLQGTLEKLSEFGRNPEGGVTRLGFSETDLAARQYVMELMKQAGLQVRVDPAGNIFGLRAGSEKLPILLFGSHIDSVLHGGNFDGDVGSMGAIEVMRALNDGNVKRAIISGSGRWDRALRLGRLGQKFSNSKTSKD